MFPLKKQSMFKGSEVKKTQPLARFLFRALAAGAFAGREGAALAAQNSVFSTGDRSPKNPNDLHHRNEVHKTLAVVLSGERLKTDQSGVLAKNERELVFFVCNPARISCQGFSFADWTNFAGDNVYRSAPNKILCPGGKSRIFVLINRPDENKNDLKSLSIHRGGH